MRSILTRVLAAALLCGCGSGLTSAGDVAPDETGAPAEVREMKTCEPCFSTYQRCLDNATTEAAEARCDAAFLRCNQSLCP
ncbi:hypothetical protein DRW03_12785 [Corallococcus sp. H22C18031201]|uniref:hypothetical protein n=1 Tax=Citreicoccus inhibens TaxID=2849499 RepID=UPI000E74B1A8|nr:hypothetical protein [Citreicoccus inhibens]MBU8894101.1 hypothetical protein [Citreicoccus inhibens]RJS23186.1 hypothetical protein DRW03_12785 [Corallococcus sp. H22C18031201]